MSLATRPSEPNLKLRLPDLSITGFRGIESLTVPHLGRVTLLTGKNGVGKTTVLEAIYILVHQGRQDAAQEVLQGRRAFSVATDIERDKVVVPDWSALFYDYKEQFGAQATIASTLKPTSLKIAPAEPSEVPNYQQMKNFLNLADNRVLGLKFAIDGQEEFITPRNLESLPSPIPGVFIETDGIPEEMIAQLWAGVALKDSEEYAIGTLREVLELDVQRVAVFGDNPHNRRIAVKIKGHDEPVPLRGLGDGAVRLFTVALALANCGDGFVLIDEAENGIHYSVQRSYWRMVLKMAAENDVQVLATTHSWDCVQGFAQAAAESTAVDGVLVRLERDNTGLYAVEYPEGELIIAAEQGIEVR